jgi:hypothetical protein
MADESFDFQEVRRLLRACGQAFFAEAPVQRQPGQWELYQGHYRAHTEEVPFEVLYLLADVTKDGVQQAKRDAFKPKKTIVVYPKTLDNKGIQHHKLAFQSEARKFWTSQAYLKSFMEAELSKYREGLQTLAPGDESKGSGAIS